MPIKISLHAAPPLAIESRLLVHLEVVDIEAVDDDVGMIRFQHPFDGLHLLTGCDDGVARFWDLQTHDTDWTWKTRSGGNINSVAISDRLSRALAVDSSRNNLVALLDIETGEEIKIELPDGTRRRSLRGC